ncbi:ankyrin repeat domain-containing protein [Endozoicomonas arenosclerae]|uniref:ankyrin repeat domain-containing protein n=1 Tax=Endozoicomonas arenosclerae TaxID=1633495 RepID=UPI001C12CDBC|nr:ankyrin repeat domain-containing protein [Endozoicomonas arenosclerae]
MIQDLADLSKWSASRDLGHATKGSGCNSIWTSQYQILILDMKGLEQLLEKLPRGHFIISTEKHALALSVTGETYTLFDVNNRLYFRQYPCERKGLCSRELFEALTDSMPAQFDYPAFGLACVYPDAGSFNKFYRRKENQLKEIACQVRKDRPVRISKEDHRELVLASKMGNAEEVRRRLEQSPELLHSIGSQLLCKTHSSAVVLSLMEMKVDPNQEYDGITPLSYAIMRSNVKGVRILLDHKADPNKAFGEDNPLCTACRNGNLEMVKMLIANGAKVNTRSKKGVSALEVAILCCNLPLVKCLVESGADIDQSYKGKTPLMYACKQGYLPIVNYLLEKVEDVDKVAKGSTALRYASKKGNLPVVDALLKAKAKPDHIGNLTTPLQDAVMNDHLEVAKRLVEGGAKADLRRQNKTPLFIACEQGNLPFVQWLLEQGANPDRKLENGLTPLQKAHSCGHSEIVKCIKAYKK